MKLAVIPARGGSKRIPRKNIREFCGKPVIAWSIDAALNAACFDDVIVSTDDPGIAAIAVRHGARVPFMRPAELADDHAGTIPVVAHAIEWFQRHASPPDVVCCIYATAPLVQVTDIRQGLELLLAEKCSYAVPVTRYPFPIQRAVRVTDQRRLEMFWPEHFDSRSQDLEEAWHDAGQFYWGYSQAWTAGTPLFSPATAPLLLPHHRVQDIDTAEDWARAEWMFRHLLGAAAST